MNIFQKFAPREPEEEEQQVPVVSDDVGGLFSVVLFLDLPFQTHRFPLKNRPKLQLGKCSLSDPSIFRGKVARLLFRDGINFG